MEQIKLVIWNLDDTFWTGTISEGPIEHITRNHDIVVALAQRGVISSICSMNDRAGALAEFQKSWMADYFVLPSIDRSIQHNRQYSALPTQHLSDSRQPR